ncbi:MAG: hypothetical protein WC055_09605 [Melioribacteraceae bacterium]
MNNIFIVGTEYQLLQAQCLNLQLRKTYEKNYLGIIGNRKIDLNLIDSACFDSIILFPSLYPDGSIYKLTKKYIDKLEYLYNEILLNYHLLNSLPITLIGAHDETTEFAVLKKIITPFFYVSIEDGLANYYSRSSVDKLVIITKNILFDHIFKKNIILYSNYGEAKNEISYRLFPELSSNKGSHTDLKPILKSTLGYYWEKIHSKFPVSEHRFLEKYKEIHIVPSFYKKYDYNKLLAKNLDAIILPHPSQRTFISTQINSEKIYTGSLPLELLLYVNSNIREIHFYSPSTSIITVLALFECKIVYYHGIFARRYRSLFMKFSLMFPNNFILERP